MTKVITYTAAWCSWCHKLKDFLKANHVEFEDRDVGSKPEWANEAVKKSGQAGVPVTDVDGAIIVGFDEAAIRRALKLK